MNKVRIVKTVALVLVLSMLFSLIGCSTAPNPSLPNSNQQQIENVQTESIIVESIQTEGVYYEHISTEIYQEELVLAEQKITELLLEEETIEEVVLCQSIYVSQDNLEEFSKNSQMAGLFGDDIDLKALLTKIAVGTGVIVTLVVLKRVGIPNELISSVVVAAADEAMKFSATGTAIGSLFGGMTGAADEIDSTGRTSAVIGFAMAVAGLVVSIISAVAAAPSAGSSSIPLAFGVKLVIAGISTITTVYAGYNAVKTFTTTDAADIDWNNIDWNAVGASAAEQAINRGADGYMWGALIGAVDGGAQGFDYYMQFGTPYSSYKVRLAQTPKDDEWGHWTGARGESDYVYDKATTIKVGNETFEIEAGTKVTYSNGVPDFSPFEVAKVKISSMTNNRTTNFNQADEALAQIWNKIQFKGKGWTASDVAAYRRANGLTWHEMNNMEYMQLVPKEINAGFGHLGGVGEYNVMVGQTGGTGFDG